MADEPVPRSFQRRCATHDPSTGDRARMAGLERTFLAQTGISEAAMSVTIEVAFIHVVNGGSGKITKSQREKQIAVLNSSYSSTGISFRYDESKVIEVDDASFFNMGHDSLRERQCKSQNQVLDPTRGLNFYTAEPGEGLLGWARFPFQMEGDPDMDGVVILHSTLPDGTLNPYNLGATAVHEIGHWLGLYHTFQDGCSGAGDEVADTPRHSGPNFNKPTDAGQPWNLCPSEPPGSKCPIHNYMNYVDDDTMNEFTPGQISRMWAQVGMFRTGLLAPSVGEAVGVEEAVAAAAQPGTLESILANAVVW